MTNIYAFIVDGIVANTVVADAQWVASQSGLWVAVPLDVETGLSVPVGIGFTYDAVNDVFVAPEVSEVVE
jgi:hypothetical protein